MKKQAGFSLLFREEALGNTRAGWPAIIPGDPDGSELVRRIELLDPEERMPLDAPALSQDWIDQEAKWKDHWAFVQPQPVLIPQLTHSRV